MEAGAITPQPSLGQGIDPLRTMQDAACPPPTPPCRAGLDLRGTEATLRQLQAWQDELEGMPLATTAGLLHVDASELRACLLPVVASARERISRLLLELASDSGRGLLHELTVWLEVAAARPPELDGFLPWAAGLADMRQGSAAQLAAAAAADDALELVVAFAGRLPTAEAVKRDDLREAAGKLGAELAAAAAWEAEQRWVHAGAVAEQARQLAEEAVMLERELKVGRPAPAWVVACWRGRGASLRWRAAATALLVHQANYQLPFCLLMSQTGVFADAGGDCGEVLGELELAQSRLAQLAAQAGEAGQLQRELGGEVAAFREVEDAGATLQVRRSLPAISPAGRLHCWKLRCSVAFGWHGGQQVAEKCHASVAAPLSCSAARRCGAWCRRQRRCLPAWRHLALLPLMRLMLGRECSRTPGLLWAERHSALLRFCRAKPAATWRPCGSGWQR